MRISLNLYNNPVYKQNYKQNFTSNEGYPYNEGVNLERHNYIYPRNGIMPASMHYNWKKVGSSDGRKSTSSTSRKQASSKPATDKVVNSKAHPPKVKVARPFMTVEKALRTFKNPNDMQDYFVAIYDLEAAERAKDPGASKYFAYDHEILSELVQNSEHKINKSKLSKKTIEELEDSEREEVRLGALFAYWSTHYDGESRYGFTKPPYIRSTHEFITSLATMAPYDAPAEFSKFLDRLPKRLKDKEAKKQARNDEILRREWEEYRAKRGFDRFFTPYPTRKLTYLQQEEHRIVTLYNDWAEKEDRKSVV